jgi:putative peptidoglycan lipid II flippase
MLLGLGVLQLNTLLDGLIASYPVWFGSHIAGVEYPLDLQSNAVLFYAQRLYQFPLGVFGIAIATAIFPALARSAARDQDELNDILRRGVRLTLYIGLPASIGLMLVRTPLATVILRGYEFTAEDVERVSAVLFAYAPAVWAYSLNQVLTRACYACDDARAPLRIAVAMVSLNLVLNILLIWVLQSETGLAWSTSICAIIQSGLLLRACTRHVGRVTDADTLRAIARMLAACIVMTLTVLAIGIALDTVLARETWLSHLVHLLVLATIGAGMYLFASFMLRMDEWKWLMRRSG